MDYMHDILKVILLLVVIKSVTIGSSYNLYKWIKEKDYNKKYWEWVDKMP